MTTPPTTTPWVPMWPLEAATPPDVEGIPADVVVPAAAALISNKYAAGDANYGYVLYGDGKQVFGDGTAVVDVGIYRSAPYTLKVGPYLEVEQSLVVGSLVNSFINMPQDNARIWMGVNYDVNLYRSAAGILTSDGRIQAKDANVAFHAVTTGYSFMSNVAGDPQGRFAIGYSGSLEWGDGSAARDSSLVRYYGAGIGTPGDFIVGGTVNAGGGRAPGGWAFRITAVGEPQARFFSDNTGVFQWGDGTNPLDTTLWRGSANALATHGSLTVEHTIAAGTQLPNNNFAFYTGFSEGSGISFLIRNQGKVEWGDGYGGALDTFLYRFAASTLKTDGALLMGMYAVVNYGHATDQLIIGDVSDWMGAPANRPGIIFGTASDAALAYDAPGILRCTGHLRITGQVNVSGGYIDLNTDTANIRFGAALDTNLYRAAAAQLKTDGGFYAVGTSGFGWTGGGWALQINQAGQIVFADGSMQTTAAGGAVGYGASLPAGANGQEYVLVDSTTAPTFQWRFRYNAGSSYPHKWEFIGGSPAVYESAGSASINSNSYADPYAGVIIALTTPRTGYYLVQHGFTPDDLTGNNAYGAFCSLSIGGAVPSDEDAAFFQDTDGGNKSASVMRTTIKLLTAGQVVKLQYRMNGGPIGKSLRDQFLSLQPIRVA